VKYDGAISRDLLVLPERRLTLTSAVQGQIAKTLSSGRRHARLEAGTHIVWHPRGRGTDYRTSLQLRVGRIIGTVPFDEQFSIGLDRDHDLRMRAHPGTRQGRKGVGIRADGYALMNSEVQKDVFRIGLLDVKAAPYLDVARTGAWFIDAGIEVRVSVASLLTVSFSSGRDLMGGRTAFFTDVRENGTWNASNPASLGGPGGIVP
jgi:hypothetical protein